MTRKDYVAIADIMQANLYTNPASGMTEEQLQASNHRTQVIAQHLAQHFAGDNPQFDRARFLKACGLDTQQVVNNGK